MGEAAILVIDVDIVFDAGDRAEFGFDDDAAGMGVFNDFFGRFDVLFIGESGGVDHDAGETSINGLFADFDGFAVVEVKGEFGIGEFLGRDVAEGADIERVHEFPSTAAHHDDDRGLEVVSGTKDGAHDVEVVEIESSDTVFAFMGTAEHFGCGY